MGSKGSSKGSIVNGRERRVESNLERKVLYCLLANRNIVAVRDQWPVVPYKWLDGSDHEHTFDFWVRFVDGSRKAIAVRPQVRVNALPQQGPSLAQVMTLIKAQDLQPFADGWAIYTDRDVSEDDVQNALNILRARRNRQEDDYQEALAYIEPICGTVRFHDLINGANVPAYRRIALWCLIDDGILVPASHGRIGDRSPMLVNRHFIQHAKRAV